MLDIIDVAGKLGRAGGTAPGHEGLNLDHFAVRIDPFDETEILAFCERNNIEARAMKSLFGADGYGPAVYITDPDGNRMELKGPPSINQPAELQ